jgi:hypothetical protein
MAPISPVSATAPSSTPDSTAAPRDPHPACANVSPSDPADQCLHNKIQWENRWDANLWGGYNPVQGTFFGGVSYEPTLAHFGARLEGSYSPALKQGGTRATAGVTLPLNEKLSIYLPVSVGASADASQGRTWYTIEGGVGGYLRYQPTKNLRLSAGGELQARYRWAPDADKWNDDIAMAKDAEQALEQQVNRRLDQFGRDVDAQLANLSPDARVAFKQVMDSYLGALRANALGIALAALTPGKADDAAARAGLDRAGDAALAQMDQKVAGELASLKSYVGGRIQQLIQDVKNDASASWSDYQQRFKVPFEDGGGANVKIVARLDAQVPVKESQTKDGGGLWVIGGAAVSANIPLPVSAGPDQALLSIDLPVTQPALRFSPYLGLRVQAPNKTVGAEVTGQWNPTLSFGSGTGLRLDLSDARVMLSPFIRF